MNAWGCRGDGKAVPPAYKKSAVTRWLHVVKTACLGLRSVRNYAIPFHNFYKIVPLHSVFAPVEFSAKTLTSPINCCKQIQN